MENAYQDYTEILPIDKEGFRFSRLDLYNWGNYNNRLARIVLDGRNALLTGRNGVGKSTLIDAISTLLVSQKKSFYNKAADSTKRERTLTSYVRGYYGKGYSNETGASPILALRKKGNVLTLLMGVFECKENNVSNKLSLLQVLWIDDTMTKPNVSYFAINDDLDLQKKIIPLKNMKEIKKTLKSLGAMEFDSFTQYYSFFKRRLGLDSDQAMDLFNKTISLRGVDNISSFVKANMLQPYDADRDVDKLIEYFKSLSDIYAMLCKEREQLEKLKPIITLGQDYERMKANHKLFDDSLKFLESFMVPKFIALFTKLLLELGNHKEELERNLSTIAHEITSLKDKEVELRIERDQNGGNRITEIDKDINTFNRLLSDVKNRYEGYRSLIKLLNESMPLSAEDFEQLRLDLKVKETKFKEKEQKINNEILEKKIKENDLNKELKGVKDELTSLINRKNNIGNQQNTIRQGILDELNIDEMELPFVGELLKVKDKDKERWEGAIERALHSYALSILVPEKHYKSVVNYVETHNLKGRLVYFAVKNQRDFYPEKVASNSLISKLDIKDCPFKIYLQGELSRKFDYICVDNQDEFRREENAITENGQIKQKGGRHEKDDRNDIRDRRFYVLGWSNKEKIEALKVKYQECEDHLNSLLKEKKALEQDRQDYINRITLVSNLGRYKSFAEIDYKSIETKILDLQKEKEELQKANSKLEALDKEIKETKAKILEFENKKSTLTKELGITETKISNYEDGLSSCKNKSILTDIPNDVNELLTKLFQKEVGKVEDIRLYESAQIIINDYLNKKINTAQKNESDFASKLTLKIRDFCNIYPDEFENMAIDIDTWHILEDKANYIEREGLPECVERFKDRLDKEIIQQIAHFHRTLEDEAKNIFDRISEINTFLHKVDYNKGRYIKLKVDPSKDIEIKTFRAQLVKCVSNTFSQNDSIEISEEKFKEIKLLIDKLNGRDNTLELDKKWRTKVIDIRNWHEYIAVECYRENDEVHESYEDADGKSGGHKEKLAYTILATSLAYQYGIDSNDHKYRSFRFVVIDEAFGRESHETTEYILTLFRKLGLQLLIVTPMQKIDLLERFVQQVILINKNETTQHSSINNYSINEYRKRKELTQKLAQGLISQKTYKEESLKITEEKLLKEAKDKESFNDYLKPEEEDIFSDLL